MNLQNRNSSTQSALSLYSLRGKSWSYFQKHINNLIDNDTDSNIGSPNASKALNEHRADVQRLDIKDYELYGISPSDPGPMVLCNQCNHIMAPEGIVRHVKRVHGSKIVPAASSKSRIAMLLASRAHTTASSVFASNSNTSITNNTLSNSGSTSSLTTAFSNRLNLSKMAPPVKSLNSEESKQQATNSTAAAMSSIVSLNAVNNSVSATAASTLSSSSNSNSPTGSLKTVASGSSSSNGGRRNRKILPIKYREYDPEKHCGVIVGNIKPCTRSLTCKTHQISLRRNVDGRSKPFDQLLAEHRNNVKDGLPKSSSSKQLNLLDNSNHLALDSIADSNSSSSFDLERRSFSSNSNQSSYNNDHVYPPQTSSSQSISGLTLMSSSASTATATTAPASTGNSTMPQSRKPLQPTFSIDNAAINNTAMDNVNSPVSIMQIPPSSNNLNTSNAASTNLNNLSDYAVQINQLNELIDDDNGDCLDMSFWESFDNNFTYENDLLATNSTSQSQQQQLQQQQSFDSKLGVKRSMSLMHETSMQDSDIDSKRKRGNVSPAIKSNIRERQKASPNSKEMAISMIAAEIAHSSASFDAQPTTTATIPNGGIFRDQMSTLHNSSVSSNSGGLNKQRAIEQQRSGHGQDVICIDDDDDDTNNNLDATVNRNSEKDTVRIRASTSSVESSSLTNMPGDMSPKKAGVQMLVEQPQPLQTMILSIGDDIIRSTDLKNVTKILSENDHRQMSAHTSASDSKSQPITAVPIDENENYLLDIVYKCLRDKGARTINLNYSNGGTASTCATINGNSSSTSNASISGSHRNGSTRSRISCAIGVDKEKENALDQQSDDECVATFPGTSSATSGATSNSLLIPAGQRHSAKIHHVGLPRPINTNRFGMARGRGISQFKHAIDSTKKTQQQIFHRLQSQQPNGATYSGSFSNANMIALRNNGSLMRFNSSNLISSGIVGNVTTFANNGIAINTAKGVSPATEQNAMAKCAMKKAVPATIVTHNANPNVSASGAVLVCTDTSTPSATVVNSLNTGMLMAGNQTHYAILRRQPMAKNPSMQILSTRTSTTEPTNSFSVMPVIHRVRARTMTPPVPKNLQAQTDLLLQSLPKSIRSKILASTLLSMAAKKFTPSTPFASSSSSSTAQSHSIPNATSLSTANSTSTGTSSNSSHNTISKHSASTTRQPSKLSHTSSFSHKSSLSTSISSSTVAQKNSKQNGHYNANASSTGGSDSMYSVNSLSRNLSNSSSSTASGASPSYHRSGSNHRSSASLLLGVNQIQNSPSIDSVILPKIIS